MPWKTFLSSRKHASWDQGLAWRVQWQPNASIPVCHDFGAATTLSRSVVSTLEGRSWEGSSAMRKGASVWCNKESPCVVNLLALYKFATRGQAQHAPMWLHAYVVLMKCADPWHVQHKNL